MNKKRIVFGLIFSCIFSLSSVSLKAMEGLVVSSSGGSFSCMMQDSADEMMRLACGEACINLVKKVNRNAVERICRQLFIALQVFDNDNADIEALTTEYIEIDRNLIEHLTEAEKSAYIDFFSSKAESTSDYCFVRNNGNNAHNDDNVNSLQSSLA